MGKSTLIKNSFLEKKLKYIYFPIGGDINRKQILQRLNNLDLKNNQKIGFHLDLYDTNQTEIISEFLFSFLITKCYHLSNEDILINYTCTNNSCDTSNIDSTILTHPASFTM